MSFTNLLDVAIVLAAIYIALSTLSSFIYEQIATLWQLRGKKLYLGVLNLVTARTLADAIFAHPAIDTTVNDKGGIQNRPGTPNRPPYIDPHNFAVAFWDELANSVSATFPAITRATQAVAQATAMPAGDARTVRLEAANDLLAQRKAAANDPKGTGVLSDVAHFEDLRQVVESLPLGELKSSALSLIALAQNDYSKLLTATEAWFNRQMAAVQGWYTRQSRYIMIPIALVIVMLSGLDTFEIAQRLYTAPAIVSAAAGQVINAYGTSGNATQPAVAQAASSILNGNDFREFFHPCLGLPGGRPCFVGDRSRWEADRVRDRAALDIAQVQDKEAKDKVADDRARVTAAARKLEEARDSKVEHRIRAEESNVEALLKTADDDRTNAQTAAAALNAAQTANAQYAVFTSHLLGWFVTLVAITLGAPFWFDVANKIVNVRNTGAKPSDGTS